MDISTFKEERTMKRNILNKAVSILLCIACLMVTIPSSVFADDMSTDVAMGDYYIGNTASNIINGGTIAFYGDVTYFSNELMNGSLCYQKNSSDDINVISEDKVENINISSDGYTIYYSTNGREIKSVNANEPASVVFQSEDEIAQMYLVNDTLLYYLSAGYIHCYDIGAQEDTVIYDKMKLCGFIPNAYGIILITGEMFNYTLYANEKVLADNVLTYRTEDEKLIFDKGENTYQISLKDAFQNELSDDKIDLYQLEDDDVYLFSDFDDENVEDNIDEATVIDQDLELGYDAGDISYPVELFASSGVQNVIKRARQQTEINGLLKKM